MCFIVQTPVSPQVNVTHEVQLNSNSPYVQRHPVAHRMIYLKRQNSDRDYPVLHLTLLLTHPRHFSLSTFPN